MRTYDTPQEEVIGGLKETLGKILTYREYLKGTKPVPTTKMRHEDEKIRAIQRAIQWIENHTKSPTTKPQGESL